MQRHKHGRFRAAVRFPTPRRVAGIEWRLLFSRSVREI
jgi:hypothetical protein